MRKWYFSWHAEAARVAERVADAGARGFAERELHYRDVLAHRTATVMSALGSLATEVQRALEEAAWRALGVPLRPCDSLLLEVNMLDRVTLLLRGAAEVAGRGPSNCFGHATAGKEAGDARSDSPAADAGDHANGLG